MSEDLDPAFEEEGLDAGVPLEKKGSGRPPVATRIGGQIMECHDLLTDDYGLSYLYTGKFWKQVTKQHLLAMAYDAAGPNSASRTRGEIVDYLKVATFLHELEWARVADHEVACDNGVLNLQTWGLRPHKKEDRLERVIPWSFGARYTAGESCPVWEQALIDWFGEDEAGGELIAALQEFAGYVCMSHAKYKKALVLKGESDTGKSQVLYVFEQLAGEGNSCQLSVEHMDDLERRAVIKGKTLNVMSELSEDALIADGGFKTMISTEDPLLISAKWEPTQMIRPAAKHIISTNNLPRLNDKTKATFNRLLIIPMERVIPHAKQDRTLQQKLLAEMPGIFAWALEGARRLLDRKGVWPTPAKAVEILSEYREEANPAIAFMSQCWEEAPHYRVPLRDVAAKYNDWQGGSRKASTPHVSGLLKRAGFDVRKVRPGGSRPPANCLVGYRYVAPPTEEALNLNQDD